MALNIIIVLISPFFGNIDISYAVWRDSEIVWGRWRDSQSALFLPVSPTYTYRLAFLQCFSDTNSCFPDSLCHVLWPGGRQLSIRASASAGQRERKREKEPSEENASSLYGIIPLHAGHIIELLSLPLHIFQCKPVGWNDKDLHSWSECVNQLVNSTVVSLFKHY